MLKKIVVNGKEIPVPIPLLKLNDAMAWLENTLLKKGELITRLMLDNEELSTDNRENWNKITLSEKSKLFVRCDTPRDLSIQTLDVVRDLSVEIDKRLKFLAVKFWQIPEEQHIKELKNILNDMTLILDLVDHVNGMVDYSHADMAALNGCILLFKRVSEHLKMAFEAQDWRQCARILVNRLEPLLKDIIIECESAEIRVFSALPCEDEIPKANFSLV